MKIAIYGAGQYGEIFYKIISKYEKIDYFIDKYKKGKLLDIPIISIKQAKKMNLIIYNSVATYEKEVKKDLEVIDFIDTLKKYPEIINEFYNSSYLWLSGKLIDKKLSQVREFLNDEVSLIFFDKWINFRETFDIKFYPYPTNRLEEQYFIDEFKYSNRFVDCGGFIGDTIESYYKLNDGKLISFEPDSNNLKKLQKKAKNRDVLIYPLGVYSKTTILKFNSQGSGSCIDEKGNLEIAVTGLDETIYNFKPDYIKMDIEGAEIEAIKGAKNIIKDFSPNLAISIYHKANDLWEIPLLIKEINPNYEFKIRCHNHLCLETILYCKVTK